MSAAVLIGFPLQAMASETDEARRITGILPNRSETVYWEETIEGMSAAAQEYGAELTMLYTEEKIMYTELTLNESLEITILTEPDAVILPYSQADEETDRLLLELREAGTKVILIDCDGDAALRDAYVGIDNTAAGYALGTLILENLGEEEIVVASLTSDLDREKRANVVDRIKGFQSAFEEEPDRLHTVAANSDLALVRGMGLTEYIMEHDNIGAVATFSERATIIGAQVLANLDETGQIRLYGFDQSEETMELLADGSLQALVGQQQYEMGRQSIETALKLIDGIELESDIVTIDFELMYGETK